MPVPTKPNEQRIRLDRDFTWEQFAKDCLLNKYALVIGSEAILDRNVNPEADGNSLKLLFDLTLHQMATNNDTFDESEYLRLKNKYSDFTTLLRKHNNYLVKECVLGTVRNNDFEPYFNDEIEPSFFQLLQTHCFRVVLSTTIDPYVEIAMEKVWGKGNFDIIQIENAKQSFKRVSFDEFGVSRPVLCYVFGKVDANKSLSENRFVLSENDAMEKVSSWFENQRNNNFLKYVRNFRLLSIGCQFDDWMFRFFWYLLRGCAGTSTSGQVAVEIKNDEKLRHYLENEKVKMFADARLFMQEATQHINKASDVALLPRRENGVFISYAHEDRYIALPLFERLRAANINVWLDEENLDSGTEYRPHIQNAINNCRIFMPILSSQVKEDLVSNKIKTRWYNNELDWAEKRYKEASNISRNGQANFKIVPVIIGDYRFTEAYHKQLPDCIVNATAFETAKESFDVLIKLIDA